MYVYIYIPIISTQTHIILCCGRPGLVLGPPAAGLPNPQRLRLTEPRRVEGQEGLGPLRAEALGRRMEDYWVAVKELDLTYHIRIYIYIYMLYIIYIYTHQMIWFWIMVT